MSCVDVDVNLLVSLNPFSFCPVGFHSFSQFLFSAEESLWGDRVTAIFQPQIQAKSRQ